MSDNDFRKEEAPEAAAAEESKEPTSGTWDEIVHNSVIVLMAQLISGEFKPDFIYANSADWEKGGWKKQGEETEENVRLSDIVVGDPQTGKVGMVVEVETKKTIDEGNCSKTWKKSSEDPLIVVAPSRRLKETLRDSVKGGIQLEEIWLYELRDWNIRLRRDSTTGERPLLKTTEIEGEIIFHREEEKDSASVFSSDSFVFVPKRS